MKLEYIVPKVDRAICALVGHEADERKIRFSELELRCLKHAQLILDKASTLYNYATDCEPDENPYLVASVEIGYCI